MSVFLLALALFGCGGGEEGAAGGAAVECDLSFETLEGKTFVMSEAQPDQTYKDNPMARVKFVKGEGGMEALYTAKSVSDVYTYYCSEAKGEGEDKEMYCAEKERPQDWCQALEVNEEGSCSRKALRKLGIEKSTDDEIKEAMKAARAEVKKAKEAGGRELQLFELNNNNLGNKLQGRMYVKVDDKRCRLSLSDMYFTIHQGKKVEDTNPVGINPFVETDDALMFEHCDEGRNVVADMDSPELPKDRAEIPVQPTHDMSKPVHYVYLGENTAKAEEGCTYTADTWVGWKPGERDLVITPEEDGTLLWRASHTWEADQTLDYAGKTVGVFEMVRYKTCNGGEREKINTTCNLSLF